MSILRIVLLAIFATLFLNIDGERPFEVILDSFNCSVNPDYAISPYCYLNSTVDPVQVFFNIEIQRKIPTIKYNWVLFLIRRKSDRRHPLLNVKNMDGCKFLAGVSVIPLLNIFRNILLAYGTMPMKCPMEKDSRFLFNGLVIDSEKFPPYVPETQFIATVNVSWGKHFIFAVTGAGKVLRKSNI